MYTVTMAGNRLLSVKFVCLLLAVAASPPCSAQNEYKENCASPSSPLRIPQYSIGQRISSDEKPPRLYLQISVSPEAAAEGTAMLGLACKLASEFPQAKSVEALIFDDKTAARLSLTLLTEQRNHAIYLWHLRARYDLDREKKEHSIQVLYPEGERGGLMKLKWYKIRISLDDSVSPSPPK
jgi:hypothetical protein